MASAGGLGWPDGAVAVGSPHGLGWQGRDGAPVTPRHAGLGRMPVDDSAHANGIGGDMGRRRGPVARDTGEQGDVVSEGSSMVGNVAVGGAPGDGDSRGAADRTARPAVIRPAPLAPGVPGSGPGPGRPPAG